ncbi:hypothetical protein MMC25_005089 [Agyrium rufum]|nr:hypothetical protein [Agyrium rufum]
MTANAERLFGSLSANAKTEIVKNVFNVDEASTRLWRYEEYFSYFADEISRIQFASQSRTLSLATLAAQNVGDLIYIGRTLTVEQHHTRADIRSILKQQFPRATVLDLDRSVDLTICLKLMVNVRDPSIRLLTPQTPVLDWSEGTFECFLRGLFRPSTWNVSTKSGRLDPHFTAANMVRICQLEIRWTQCLADHLRLDRRKRILWIFPYKRCLLNYLEGAKQARAHNPDFEPLLPWAIYEETLDSLDLLFPHWDKHTDRLMKKHGKSFHQLGPFNGSRSLNLAGYLYWRDRLSEVYEEVYRCPPASWAQLWADRRNPQQWWTFWIALFILLLTVISTVASLVQAWASLKALHAG